MSGFIGAGFDAAEFAGADLFSRDADTVAAPALASLHDGGHYPDAGAFLHGWSTSRTLSSLMTTIWGGGVTVSIGINSSNLVALTMSGGVAFTVTPGSDDPWGWGGVIASSGGTAVGTLPWTRGPFELTTDARFSVTRGASTSNLPTYETIGQSLPTLCTGPSASDPDEVIAHLEEWDNDACDATLRRFRWHIDAEGRTVTSWPDVLTDIVSPTWISAALRRALGFTGSESEVLDATSGWYTLTSTYPARGVLIVRQGIAQLDPMVSVDNSAFDLGSGRVAGRPVTALHDFDVACTLRGGVGLDEAASAYRDEAEIYRTRVARYLHRGARCTIIPEWGDPRLGLSKMEQFAGGLTAAQFSTTRRADVGGIMGRRRCEVATDAPGSASLAFGSPRTSTGLRLKLRAMPVV